MLWIHYEDLHEDLPACVKLLADFLQIGHDDPELQQLAVEQASIEHMRKVGGLGVLRGGGLMKRCLG